VAGRFVRLKLAVTANTLRRGDVWSLLGVIGIWLISFVVGLGGGLLLAAALSFAPGSKTLVAVAVALNLVWILVPIVASAIDATLDPRSFELLPLTPTELGRGLLVASAVGPGGLATLLFLLIGFGIGAWPGWSGAIVVPALTALLVLIVVVSGRLATTLVSEILGRNRVGEIVSVVFALLAVSSVVVSMNLAPGDDAVPGLAVPGWVPWLSVLPSGSVGAAMASFGAGDWWVGLGHTAWATVGAALLVWAYGTAVTRLQTRSTTQRKTRVRADADVLGTSLTRFVPSPSVRVAAAKELRYLRRDPRLRAQLLGGFVTLLVFGFIGASVIQTPLASFLSVVATWAVVASVAPNQFGADGRTFWAYVVAPTELGVVLAGKNLAWAMVAAPVAGVVGAIGAVMGGSAEYLLTGWVTAGVVFLVWTAVGNFTSVYGAFPFPEKQLFGANAGGSGRAVIVSLLGLAASAALTAVPAVAIGVAIAAGGPGPSLAAAAASALYATLLYVVAFRVVRQVVRERRFALVEVLDA
jgi:ABC-2 type transport system permease protein